MSRQTSLQVNAYLVAIFSALIVTVLTQLFSNWLLSAAFTLFYPAIVIIACVSAAVLINHLISALKQKKYLQHLSNRHWQQSEQQLRLALQAAQMGLWNWDIISGKLVWSPEHEQLFGLSPGSFDGRYETFDARLHPDDRAGLNQAIAAAMQNHQIYKHEYRIIWPDHSVHWVEGIGQTFYDSSGQPIYMSGTIMNIDDRKQIEIALQQSEQRFRTIFEAEPECVKIITADGILQNINPAGLAIIEADSLDQVIGSNICPMISAEYRSAFLEFNQQVAQGQAGTLEFEILGLKGSRRWLESYAVPLQTHTATQILTVTRDITKHKQVEAALRESERNLANLIRNLPGYIYRVENNINYTPIFISEGVFAITGHHPQEYLIDRTISCAQEIHPDDRSWIWHTVQQAVIAHQSYTFTYRIFTKSGEQKWLWEQGYGVYAEDGELRFLEGFVTDVTQRKQAEIALERAKQKLEQRVAERTTQLQKTDNLLHNFFDAAASAAIGLCIHDQNLRFIRINAALAKINGHSVAAHLGKTVSEILPELAPTVNPLLQQVLSSGTSILNQEIAAAVPNQPGLRHCLASFFPIADSYNRTKTVGVGAIVIEISDRKRAEDALRVSQARLAGILDHANDAIISIDTKQRITLFNQGAEKIFAYTAAEVIGQPLQMLLPCRFATIYQQHVQKSAASGENGPVEARLEVFGRRKDGSEFPAEASISRLILQQEHILTAFLRDITEQKQAEAVLAQLASIVASSNEAIISKTLNGTIVSWNASAERLFGYRAEEMIGQSVTRIIPLDRLSEETQILEQLKRGERIQRYETVRRRKDGRLIDISVTISPIKDATGTIVGASKIAHDITKQRAIERMKAEFISIVSHELRTPLTSINGALELLSSGLIQPDSARGKETIQIAAVEADRLTRLVDDILDLERLESGIKIEYQAWNLSELMHRAVDFMQLSANQAAITLSVDPLPVTVQIDGDRILQVLTNLLSNAIKFSPPSSTVWLTAKICKAEAIKSQINTTFSTSWKSSSQYPAQSGEIRHNIQFYVLMTVRDQGRGIPVDKLESIFERFHQVDASDARSKGGTGLGLAICRSIVQQHGGYIWAESGLEQGSRFQLALPLGTEHRQPHVETNFTN